MANLKIPRSYAAALVVAASASLAVGANSQTRSVTPTTPPKLAPSIDAAQRRIMTPPPSLTKFQLIQRLGGTFPDLTTAFSLTPAQLTVAKRGQMKIDGKITVPDPLPPGFRGHAQIRHVMAGMGGAGAVMGTIDVTIQAQKDVFYAIDCLAAINDGSDNINYTITGAGPKQTGQNKLVGGHVVFTARRTDASGPITIRFHPDKWMEATKPYTRWINEMDFWGCDISSSG